MDPIYCCNCMKEIPEESMAHILAIPYDIPEDQAEEVYCIVCVECGEMFNDPIQKDVMIMMLNSKVARCINPDKSYTPEQ